MFRRLSFPMIFHLNRQWLRRSSEKKFRVRLNPGNQHSIEEIREGISNEDKTKIEKLYEFEKLQMNDELLEQDKFRHHLQRGQTSVFDLEDLLVVLRDERIRDICVMEIPPEQQYATFMVLGTAFSGRHLNSVSDYIYKLYKAKKNASDPQLSNQCRQGNRWHAMDMGYLVLHLMDEETRVQNDLETLWCVGPKYDDQIHLMQQSLDAIKKLDEELK